MFFVMSSPTPITEMTFVPRDLVTIQVVGRLSANVYPKVEPGTSNFECAHAIQVIKSILKPLPIDTHLILDAIGLQLNSAQSSKGSCLIGRTPSTLAGLTLQI
jgi:hypothetical protein